MRALVRHRWTHAVALPAGLMMLTASVPAYAAEQFAGRPVHVLTVKPTAPPAALGAPSVSAPATVAPKAKRAAGKRPAKPVGAAATAAEASYPEFEKSEQLLGWINGYRENPEPKRLPQAVAAMSRLGLLRDMDSAGLYVGFVAGVLGSNPALAEELVAKMFPRPPEEQGLIIKAIAYSGLEDWRGLLVKFVERMPARRKQIDTQLYVKPETLETVALETGPAPIDALWGYHFATGSYQPVERIVAALAWAGDKSDAEKLTIGSMAKWTLASNAMRDKALLDWLREAGAGKSKEIVKELREVVVAAESFEVSKLRRDALAAIDDARRRAPASKPTTWTTAVGAAPTVIGLACVAASVAGQVALGIPCVVSGALSTAVAKHWGQP